MNPSLPITLRKVAPETNMRRRYTVHVALDLFDIPLVICRWGRIGTPGQVREHVCASVTEAEALAARLLKAKQKRGYGIKAGTGTNHSARARKPAAKLRREAFGPKQLCLPGLEKASVEFRSQSCPAPATKLTLAKHLPDLASTTARRRKALGEADRSRRLDMVVDLIRAQGMSVSWGRTPSA